MFADPAAITINSVAQNLIRIRQDDYSSEYRLRSTTAEFRATIRNSSYADRKRQGVKVDRHTMELVHEIFPVAPATLSTIRKCYVVFENQQGDDPAETRHVVTGLLAFLTASSGANITKMLNFES